jgi:carbamoyl-phosphate synthase large subunit
MNVLLTCAGRRNYLVGYFRHALRGRGRILAADASGCASALQEADVALFVPPVDAPDYIETLLDLCRRNEVGLLVSLNDLELPLLAAHRDEFVRMGARPVVSSPEVIRVCFDKWATGEFLARAGLPFPATFLSLDEAMKAMSQGMIDFPLVVKPRWGSGSIGIEYPRDEVELDLAYRLLQARLPRTILGGASATDSARSILVQEFLAGVEYGLDVVNDLQGRHVAVFVKRKFAMRAGETDKAETVDAPELQAIGRKIGEALGHVGNLDCDLFVCDSGIFVMEMNPRFGGGYPFSHVAGADLPAALIAWALGETPDPSWLRVRPGVFASKCDRLVVHDEPDERK